MGMVGLRKENMSEHVDFDFELGNMIFTFEEKIRLPQTNERGFYTDIMNHDPSMWALIAIHGKSIQDHPSM